MHTPPGTPPVLDGLPPGHDRISTPRVFTFMERPKFEQVLGSPSGCANGEPEVVPADIDQEDVKMILLTFQKNWEAAVLRQEVLMNRMLKTQAEIQRDVASMQSTDNKRIYNSTSTWNPEISLNPAAIQVDTCEDTSQHQKDAEKSRSQADGQHAQQRARSKFVYNEKDSPECLAISHEQSHSAQHVLGLRKSHQYLGYHYVAGNGLRARLNRILSCKEFELMLALAIMLNALVICTESQYHGLEVGFKLGFPGRSTEAQNVWPGAETVFQIFDWCFGMLFLLEFIAKVGCWRCAYFHDFWNVLDCLFVLSFLVDKILATDAGFNPMMLRVIRLFRLTRLVRLIRFLDHLEPLYVMTTAIGGLTQTLGWAIFLLTVMLLTCDLFLLQLLQATYFSRIDDTEFTEKQLEKHREMYAYFGTSTRCLLSMFEITLANWPPVVRLLCEEVSEWCMLFCLVHKLTLGFAVLGVINGVILQETFSVAQRDDVIMVRQKKRNANALHKKMSNLFQVMDLDGDGKVNLTEFLMMCQDSDIQMWLASLDIEADDLPALFQLCDKDGNGCLSLEEVINGLPRIKGAARSIDLLSLMQRHKFSGQTSM